MQTYGNLAQFSKNGNAEGPNYQVINTAGKKIAFDSNNLLIQPDDNEFLGSTYAALYSLEQVQALLDKFNAPVKAAVKKTTTRTPRAAKPAVAKPATRSPRGGVAAQRAQELLANQKYEYYKLHRATLPPDIREHSEVITRLMEQGVSVEEAFAEAVKLCFVHV